MKFDISTFKMYYYVFAAAMGLIVFPFNMWFGIAVWILTAECIFHEPVHWAAAKFVGAEMVNMVDTRDEHYIEIRTGDTKEDDAKIGYVCLAGSVFDLIMNVFVGLALIIAGAVFAGILMIIALELIELYYERDFRMFLKLTVRS